jgi:hypothetical protein
MSGLNSTKAVAKMPIPNIGRSAPQNACATEIAASAGNAMANIDMVYSLIETYLL